MQFSIWKVTGEPSTGIFMNDLLSISNSDNGCHLFTSGGAEERGYGSSSI